MLNKVKDILDIHNFGYQLTNCNKIATMSDVNVKLVLSQNQDKQFPMEKSSKREIKDIMRGSADGVTPDDKSTSGTPLVHRKVNHVHKLER